MLHFLRTVPVAQALALICVVACSLVWPVYFRDLFPLSEFRDWLIFQEVAEVRAQSWNNLLFRVTTYSRDLPQLYVAFLSGACGSSMRCVNTLAALPLICAAAVFFSLAMTLIRSRWISTAVVCLWAVATPYFEAMAWQAIILDRVGILFALLALLAAWRLPVADRPIQAVIHSCLMLLLCVAAMNSKEAYWFVPISLFVAYVGRAWVENVGPLRARVGYALIVMLPIIVYSVWFVFAYVKAIPFATNWDAHVVGGNLSKNFRDGLRGVFGTQFLGFSVFLVTLFTVIHTLLKRPEASVRLLVLWLAMTILLAYLPAARTRGMSSYYLLPALAFLLLWCGWWIHQQFVGVSNMRTAVSGKSVALIYGGLVASGIAYSHFGAHAEMIRTRKIQSQMLINEHLRPSVVAQTIAQGRLCFQTDRHDPFPHLFVDSKHAYAILRWFADPQQQTQLRNLPVAVFLGSDQGAAVQAQTLGCELRFFRYPIEARTQ